MITQACSARQHCSQYSKTQVPLSSHCDRCKEGKGAWPQLYHKAPQVAPGIKNPLANAGDIRDAGSVPASRRSPGGRHGYPLQHSCLENPMDRGAWWAIVHTVAKSWTGLKQLSTQSRRQDWAPGPRCRLPHHALSTGACKPCGGSESSSFGVSKLEWTLIKSASRLSEQRHIKAHMRADERCQTQSGLPANPGGGLPSHFTGGETQGGPE